MPLPDDIGGYIGAAILVGVVIFIIVWSGFALDVYEWRKPK